MQRAVSAGIVLVISAGNDGEDPLKGRSADPFALVPAQTFPGQVIIAGSLGLSDGAGGTNLNQLPTSPSGRAGQNWYLALGYRVRTIDQTGTGFLYSGTSFSAPIITGAVALMAQAFPNLTAREIVDILFRTADDLGAAGDDAVFGQGRLNIGRAFQPVGTTSLAGTEAQVTDASVTGGAPGQPAAARPGGRGASSSTATPRLPQSRKGAANRQCVGRWDILRQCQGLGCSGGARIGRDGRRAAMPGTFDMLAVGRMTHAPIQARRRIGHCQP
jgi:subtilisin family serine protease